MKMGLDIPKVSCIGHPALMDPTNPTLLGLAKATPEQMPPSTSRSSKDAWRPPAIPIVNMYVPVTPMVGAFPYIGSVPHQLVTVCAVQNVEQVMEQQDFEVVSSVVHRSRVGKKVKHPTYPMTSMDRVQVEASLQPAQGEPGGEDDEYTAPIPVKRTFIHFSADSLMATAPRRSLSV